MVAEGAVLVLVLVVLVRAVLVVVIVVVFIVAVVEVVLVVVILVVEGVLVLVVLVIGDLLAATEETAAGLFVLLLVLVVILVVEVVLVLLVVLVLVGDLLAAAEETAAGLLVLLLVLLVLVAQIEELFLDGRRGLAHGHGLELPRGLLHDLLAKLRRGGLFIKDGGRGFLRGRALLHRSGLLCGRGCRSLRCLLRSQAHRALPALAAGHAAGLKLRRHLLLQGVDRRLVHLIHFHLSSFDVAGILPNRFGARRRDRRRYVLVLKIESVLVLVFVRFLVLLVHAGDEQVQEFLESALGSVVFKLFVVKSVVGVRIRTAARGAQGPSVHLDAVDVLGLAVQIVKFGLVKVRLRALPGEGALCGRFLRTLVERFLHPAVLAGMLCTLARGDVVLYAVEEANEGIKGVGILIFLFRGPGFVLRQELLVAICGIVEVLLGNECLLGLGANLLALRPERRGQLRGALRSLVRRGGGGLNRPGRFRRLRRFRRLHRPARAGFVLLVSATELVII